MSQTEQSKLGSEPPLSTEQPTTNAGSSDKPDYIQSTETIVEAFQDQNDPDYVYALVSGGGDSTTACVASQEFGIEVDAVVHCNTGTGVEETRRFVMDMCLEWDLPYIELTSLKDADTKRHQPSMRDGVNIRSPDEPDENPYADLDTTYYGTRRKNDDYEKNVRKMGFPGPSMHWMTYLSLKKKPIKRFVKYHHDDDDDVAFVSGVRKDESNRRAKNMSDDALSENFGGCTVVSPIADWTASDVSKYKMDRNIKSNPVSDILGMSGECMCGAYGSRDELKKLKQWGFDDAARRLERLEMEVLDTQVSKGYVPEEYALWGHGNNRDVDPPEEEMPQMLLCADCDESCEPAFVGDDKEDPISNAEYALEQNAHCDNDKWYYCPDCQIVIDNPSEHRRKVHSVSPEPPYINEIPWDVREIHFGLSEDTDTIDKPVTTDPELSKKKRMGTAVSQQVTCHSPAGCEYELTDQEGVSQCSECGSYKIQPDAVKDMIAASDGGNAVEDLIAVEPGILPTIILESEIDETKVITSPSDLKTVLTADDLVSILEERLNSVSEYLDGQPSFEKLLHDAGIEAFIETFNITAEDVFERSYYSNIISALEDIANDEDDDTPSLQAQYDPTQQNIATFSD